MTIVAVLAVLALVPSAASAASIVFVKGGDVWLAAPDGSDQRQVTTGGGWSFPSQADDGTIMAQEGKRLYRIGRSGAVLGGRINTIFAIAPPGTTWEGPFGDVISPDGASQAYDGDVIGDPSYDPICGCYQINDHFLTRWGSARSHSEPNQKLGQEDYVDPAWIDNSHLLLTAASDVGAAQVATYTIGGADNSEVGWFTDRSQGISALSNPAITRRGDKVAFIADDNGGFENEIRLYQTNGPPPETAGDPSNLPTDECNLTLANLSSDRVSFSPDGKSLAFGAPDGVHLLSLVGWPNCPAIAASDHVIIPGGGSPYFGPMSVRPTDGNGGTDGSGGLNAGHSVSNAFQVTGRTVRGGKITLTVSAQPAGAFIARASAKLGRGRHNSGAYGSGSVRLRHGGLVKLTINPTASAARALALAGRMVVSVTITFTPTGGTSRVKHLSMTVLARRGKRR